MLIKPNSSKTKARHLHALLYLTLGLTIPLSSKAATPPFNPTLLPGSVDPARVGNVLAPPLEPAETASVSVPGYTPRAISAAAVHTTFTLNQLHVVGATVYGNTQIENMFRNYIGRTVSLADLQRMADTITLKYRNDGYIITRAIVPAQDIRNGVATIRVVEGYVYQVTIEGNPRGARKVLESYGEKIKQARPLNIAELERYTLLANDISGVTVRAVLGAAQVPSDELAPSNITPGAANLTFVVEQHVASGSITYDNRGTKYLGPNEFTLNGNVNSIFRSGDVTGVQALLTSHTNELEYFRLYHQTPLNDEGLMLNLASSYSRSQPGYILKPLEVKGRSKTLSAGLSYPLIRTRDQSLFVNGGLDSSDSRTDALGVKLYEDRIRSLRIGANYNQNDRWLGSNQIGGQFSQGLPIFNASKNKSDDTSRPNGHSTYTKFNFNASRLQGLPHNFSLLAATQGQYAVNTVLSAEEFSFGGAQFGQAYDPAEISGDRGIAGKVELRYDVVPNWRALQGMQFFTVYDIGKVWNISPIGQIPTASAASAGVGVRTNFTNFLSGSLEVAKPLTRNVATYGNKSPRVFFSVTLAGDTPSDTNAIPLPPLPAMSAPSGTGLTPIASANATVPARSQAMPKVVGKTATPVSPNNIQAQTTAATSTPTPVSRSHFQGLTAINNDAAIPVAHAVKTKHITSTKTHNSTITSGYVLQFRSGHHLDDLRRFAANHHITDKVHYIHTQHNGGDWYLLAYGHYNSRSAAVTASKNLPVDLQRLHPWVREVSS
jgi:hemolysin activation/secretion protein